MTQNSLQLIRKLSDHQLLANADKLVKEEHRITLEVLHHLREIEIRCLFVDLKYKSMHKYCIKHLKYSEHEAASRLSAARLLKELPEIETQIANGDLNLTNLCAFQSFVRAEKMADQPLTREEKLEIISAVGNKPTRQVKQELIQQSHQPALLAEKFQLVPDTMTRFETPMTNEQLDILNEFRSLYAHELGDLSNQRVLMFLLEKAVQFKKKKLGLIETKFKSSNNAPLPRAPQVKKQRTPITIIVKRQVWKRANACCEHIDAKSKERCSSNFALETDHVLPLALGGTNDLDNLQLLCRAHNSRRSVKTFGIHEIRPSNAESSRK